MVNKDKLKLQQNINCKKIIKLSQQNPVVSAY
jgi:hypothetical protein